MSLNIPVSNPDEAPIQDYFKLSRDSYDQFDEYAWSRGEGYKIPGFDITEKNLEGLEPGYYIIAAESNMGKSAFLMNLLYAISTCEDNKLFGIYFSLDDSKNDIISRIAAMLKEVPISVVSKPKRYQDMIDRGEEGSSVYEDYLHKRVEALEELRSKSNHFIVIDSSQVSCIEDVHDFIQKAQVYVKSLNPENDIVVAIDAINDLNFSSKSFRDQRDKHTEVSHTIKKMVTEFKIPIFGTAHLKKLNQVRRPISDDLKESGEYIYDASLVWFLYNDVSKTKQAANIYQNDENTGEKLPVIEVDWNKNKKSSFKGRTYCYFYPNISKVVECTDEEVIKRYDSMIYEL